MARLILFGCGSALIADFEETCARLGFDIVVVRNRPGHCFCSAPESAVDLPSATDLLDDPVALPLFSPGNRWQAAQEAREAGFSRFAVLVDPTAIRPRNLNAEAGAFVNCGAVLGSAVSLARFALVNRAASLGHNTSVGEFASIGPGVVCAGEVAIGRGAVIGAGAVVLPKISIGDNSVVAAGAVVTRDVMPFSLVAGSPARLVRTSGAGYGGMTVPEPTST